MISDGESMAFADNGGYGQLWGEVSTPALQSANDAGTEKSSLPSPRWRRQPWSMVRRHYAAIGGRYPQFPTDVR